MHHFFVEREQITDQTITITGADVNHIRQVLRMTCGEELLISDQIKYEYVGEIIQIEETQIFVRICSVKEHAAELPAKIYLFQGLPKSDKMELIIQKAVELGVYQVIPVQTRRAIVKLDKKKEESKRKRWNSISESAAKQSRRMMIPQVVPVMSLAEALQYAADFSLNVIPYEEAIDMTKTRSLLGQVQAGMRIGIFIGPEGGFAPEEIEQAQTCGVAPITLGKRILRTETAGFTVLSVLMYLLEP